MPEGQIMQSLSGQAVNGYYYRIIQFYAVPNQDKKEELKALGILFFDYLPKNAFLVAIPENLAESKISQFNIRSIAPVQKEMKLTKILSTSGIPHWVRNGDGTARFVLGFYPNLSETQIAAELNKLGATFTFQHEIGFVDVSISEEKLDQIAASELFYYVQEADPVGEPENFRARTDHRMNVLQGNYVGGLHYDGTNVLVAHGDDGDIGPHIDYSGRLTSYAGASQGNHGDHVAGTVFGAGNLDPKGRGMAPGAEIAYFSYGQGGLYLNGVDTMYTNMGVRITQSSYSDGNNSGYTARCREMDKDIRQNRALIHVFSAGNAGTSNFGYGAGAGWGNITGGHKQGKNVIATANLTWDDQLANSSSRGPAHDGRIKPDVGAVGTDVYSAVQPQGYDYYTGTSMACPGVSGTMAALYQAFKVNNSQAEPDGGLMKAILMNTADDVGNAGPDFKHGYGRINALRAVKTIENHYHFTDSLVQGATDTIVLNVGQNVAELRVMVYWTDPEATVLASRALVNDLNFTLYNASSTSWKPWVLNPTPNATILNTPAVRATDSLNNAEQVTLVNPAAGDYQIVVNGTNIPTGPQKYYVVYSFVQDDIKLTHPIGGEHFTPGQPQIIRWDAPAGTTPFTVQYSTNNGALWTTISSTVAATARHLLWNVPATVTGQALVRVTRGVKNSICEAPFSIIGVPTNLDIAWACPDSMLFTWNAVTGATGYEISMLGQKYMDSVGTSATNQFKFTGINPSKTYWISVRALGPNGCVGERAVAYQKAPGTLGCTLASDAIIQQVNSPTLLPSCQGLTGLEVSIKLANGGTQNIYNIPLAYKIGSGAVVRDTLTDTLLPGIPQIYTFNNTFSVSGAGSYPVLVYAEMPTDQNKYNDTLRHTFRVYTSSVQPLPYTESFSTFNNCATTSNCEQTSCSLQNGWQNAINLTEDDVDFRTYSGSTPTTGTGPSADHTTATPAGKYVYLESSGTCTLKEAQLMTPCFNLTGITLPQASIWYHMYGTTMGELHVDILADGIWYLDVITPLSGNKGNSWNQLAINLISYVGKTINIRFRGITGNGTLSDLALDDFKIEDISGPPVANFAASSNAVCLNTPITLIDQSMQVPTTWQWTITPGTFVYTSGSTNTSQSPEVSFSALGSYTIKLRAQNSFGADSITKVAFITVTNGNQLPVVEDFQGTFPATNWSIINYDGQTTWQKSGQITGATGLSTTATWMDNFNYNVTVAEDVLETPKVDLNGVSSAYLTFDVAHARYSSTYIDGLRIEISTNCGATFTPTGYFKQGSVLATVPDQTGLFVPGTAGQWRKDSVNISSAINNTVVIRFVSVSGYGNSLYIDNVNIVAGGIAAPVAAFNSSKTTVCVGDTITFASTTTGPVTTYNWNFGVDATPQTANTVGPHAVTYSNQGSKTATLAVSNAGGASNTSGAVLVVDKPFTQFSAINSDTLTVIFNDFSTNNPTAWAWNFGDGNTSGNQNPTHVYSAGGTYNVTLTATNACGSTDSTFAVYVSGIGINEKEFGSGIALMPNPASQQVTLRAYFNTAQDLHVELHDITGKLLAKTTWQNASSGNDFTLPIENLPDGVYVLKLFNTNNSATKRLVVKK